MEIRKFKKALPFLFKANVTPFVWGYHGIGKSQSVKQFAEENGHGFVDIRLGTQEVGDLLGLADFLVDQETGQRIATKFMMPEWVKNIYEFCEANPDKLYVIFLDEINRARRDVLQAVFQLVLDKSFHTAKLPENCFVVAASNPNTSDYIVADIADKAFMDRFCHIKLSPSHKEWHDFASSAGVSRQVINFLKTQPELLEAKNEAFELTDVKPSRRSWEAVSRLLRAETPSDVLSDLLYGLVGKEAAIAFIEDLNNADKPIQKAAILGAAPPARDENSEKGKSSDPLWTKVKEYSSVETGGRPDLLKITCDDLAEHIVKNKLSDTEVANVLVFMKLIPADISFSLLKQIYPVDHIRDRIEADKELVEMFEKTLGVAKTGSK